VQKKMRVSDSVAEKSSAMNGQGPKKQGPRGSNFNGKKSEGQAMPRSAGATATVGVAGKLKREGFFGGKAAFKRKMKAITSKLGEEKDQPRVECSEENNSSRHARGANITSPLMSTKR